MSLSACLLRSATDKLGPPVSARPIVSYTICWDIIVRAVAAKVRTELIFTNTAPCTNGRFRGIGHVTHSVSYPLVQDNRYNDDRRSQTLPMDRRLLSIYVAVLC